MKRLTLAFLTILICSCGLLAQISQGGAPYSFTNTIAVSDAALQAEVVTVPNVANLKSEDRRDEKSGNPLRYAVLQKKNLSLENAGQWITLDNGDRIWKLKISSPDAKAINLLYNNFYLPEGASFFIYNEEKTEVLGSFTSLNNKENGLFATGNVLGTTSILEYYEPAAVSGEGIIEISKVGYVYRLAQGRQEKSSEPCEVDVNCSEGTNWTIQKKGVVRISIVAGNGQFWCTGSLINNTKQDCKPYVLTALHCGLNSSNNDFSQYIFYFNYESNGCGSGNAPENQSITGCTKRVDSGDGGGDSGSDFLLVEIANTIPTAYNPYYNGWNANNTASSSGVSIHHPAGDRKKISTYTKTLTSDSWESAAGSHWAVQWAATPNGHGVTEGGSSGSPIFNNAGLIVGQLTGGGSYCDTPAAGDLYGKMSYNWTSNPGGKLKQWLDPTNSGQKVLNGSFTPCADGGDTATCSDGIQNQGETAIDCGGPCAACPTCEDGIQNGNETAVDCGGSCSPCDTGGGDGNTCSVAAVHPTTGQTLTNTGCIASVQAADDYCCGTGWDGLCQEAYDACAGSNDDGGDTGSSSCEKPSSFSITNVKTNRTTVNWNTVTAAIKYQIRYREAGYNDPWMFRSSTVNKKTLYSLFWYTEYEYQVRTKCPTGWTGWSGKKYFTTADLNSAPIAGSESVVEETLAVSVYPNPSSGVIRLDGSGLEGITTIRVHSAVGKELLVQEGEATSNLRLNLSGFSDGIYFITIETAKNKIIERFVLAK